MAKKILIFGIDGGTWSVAGPCVRDGRMPILASLMRDGISGNLKSTIPPLTPPGWTTAFTGVSPGLHGIQDFFVPDASGHNLKLIDWTSHKSPAIWEIISQTGGTVGVLGAPVTYPPDPVNGWMVSRMGVPPSAEDWTWPLELGSQIFERCPGYVHGLSVKSLQNGDYGAWKQDLYRFLDQYEALALELLRERPVDTAVIVVDELDRLQHFFWHFFDETHPEYKDGSPFTEEIPEFYSRLDSFLGKLMNEVSWDNVLLLSDHGFGPLHTDLFLNHWLLDKKLLFLKGRVARWKLQRKKNRGEEVKPFDWFDWKRSRIHLASVSGRCMFENPVMQLNSTEREDLRGSLLELKAPSGKQMITGAHLASRMWKSGETDLRWILEEAGGYALRSELTGSLTAPATQHGVMKTGSHRPKGMGMAWGQGVQPGQLSDDASLADIAVTALDMLGLPFPENASGKSWLGGDRPKKKWKLLRRAGSNYAEEDSKAVQEHLRSLGYL